MGTMDTLAGSSSPATSAVDARSPSNVALRSFSSSAATMTASLRLLARPLAQPEGQRSDEDTMVIELILALLLNLFHTTAPDAPPPQAGAVTAALDDVHTLRSLLVSLDREHGVELIVYILQGVEESESHRLWNLTLLEILHYVLSSQSPDRKSVV